MTQLPSIAQIGEPILRQKAQAITDIRQPEIRELIELLTKRAIASKGVGIAAPQIFQSVRLFIISSHPSDRYPQAPMMKPIAMINPRILSHGTETIKDWEGCLSIPDTRGLVSRYRSIEVEYTTKDGILRQEVLTDFVARIFQHELDHLNGILFIDHVPNREDLHTEAALLHKSKLRRGET
ncbi:MAG: peptide deformylase [Cyanobacteria bacterium J06621_8]